MTTTWNHLDHDPSSHASRAAERTTIELRVTIYHSAGGADHATGQAFSNVEAANRALIDLATANDHAVGGVILEPDPSSTVTGAYHVIIHWGTSSDRYHLDTASCAP